MSAAFDQHHNPEDQAVFAAVAEIASDDPQFALDEAVRFAFEHVQARSAMRAGC